MKITDLDTTILYFGKNEKAFYDAIHTFNERTSLVVKIFTDEGITGYAVSFFGVASKAVYALKEIINREIKPVLIGEDPLLNKKIRKKIWSALEYHSVSGLVHFAISAIDIAVWDIKGKFFGEPVYKVLGGYKEKIKAYAMVGWYYDEPGGYEKALSDAAEEGFKAIKIKIGRKSLKDDIQRIKLAKSILGDDVLLMVDGNQAFDEVEALRRGRVFQDMGMYWYEEPLAPQFIDAYSRLVAKLDIPIATGENSYTKYSFLELLQKNAVNILQPDNRRAGGVTEWMEIAVLADSYGVKIASHGGNAANVNMLCAMPNSIYLESGSLKGYSPYIEKLILEDGYVLAPKNPGMGTEVKDEWIEKWKVDK